MVETRRQRNRAGYSATDYCRSRDSCGKSIVAIITERRDCSRGCTGKSTATCSGAANSCSRGPNWTGQVYVVIMATLIVTTAQFSRVLAYDHLGSLPQLAAPHGHLQYFESLKAVVLKAASEETQQEPLVVKQDRVDPLHRFKKYKGGYNLKGKHYLASTLFTGVHGYFLGTIWLLGGVIGAIALYIRRRHFRKKALTWQPFSKLSTNLLHKSKVKLTPMIFATISTILIVCCCGVACAGSQSFHTVAKKVERTIIVEGANNATRLIHNVTQMMGQMKVDIEQYDKGVAQRLGNTTAKLNNASTTLLNIVRDHKRNLDVALLDLNVAVIAISVTNIALWTIGLVCLYLFPLFPKLRRPFFMIIAMVWLLVYLNWITYGITFSISNFAVDTCEALKEYQESSKNTTLDNILPCRKLAMGNKTIFGLRQKVYNYVEQANKYITELNRKQSEEKKLKERRIHFTIQDVPRVCNPFLGPPSYSARNAWNDCSNGTIPISSLLQLLSLFKCPSNTSTKANKRSDITCVSTRQYNVASAYISAAQKLLRLLPEVDNLTACSFVVDTFTTILQKQCKPLKNTIRMVWVAMVLLSILTTFTMVLWLLQLWLVRKLKPPLVQWGGTVIPHDHPSSSP